MLIKIQRLFIRCCSLFFILSCTYCYAYFDFITSTDYGMLKRQFPDSQYTDISTFDLAHIDESVRPKLWLSRIPFIAGIADNQMSLFYYQYEPLGYSKLLPINVEDAPIMDVAVSPKGYIFAVTTDYLYVFHYLFDRKTVQLLHKLKKDNIVACAFNGKKHLAVLTQSACYLYLFYDGEIKYLAKSSEKISRQLAELTPNAIAIGEKQKITILTQNKLLFFSKKGTLLRQYKNQNNLNKVATTAYGDLLLASTLSNRIYKYTQNGQYLFDVPISPEPFKPKDLVVYKPYGNLAIFDAQKGYYYAMNTTLEDVKLEQRQKKRFLELQLSFLVTFPSELVITITDSQGKMSEILSQKKIISGKHNFNWDKLDLAYAKGSIRIYLKALYSNSNKIEQTIVIGGQ